MGSPRGLEPKKSRVRRPHLTHTQETNFEKYVNPSFGSWRDHYSFSKSFVFCGPNNKIKISVLEGALSYWMSYVCVCVCVWGDWLTTQMYPPPKKTTNVPSGCRKKRGVNLKLGLVWKFKLDKFLSREKSKNDNKKKIDPLNAKWG